MVEIRCKSNIDCAKALKWPERLPECPRVGDLIRSPSSTESKYIELEVVRVTWANTNKLGEWVAEVELWLPRHRWARLEDFEKWVCK